MQGRGSVQGKVWREGEGEQHAAPTLEHRVAWPRAARCRGDRLAVWAETTGTAHCIDYAEIEEAAL